MIITLAFANGFQQKVSEKIFSFSGHIRVQYVTPFASLTSEEIAINADSSTMLKIKADPDVQTIHPYATRYAILKTPEDLQGVLERYR